jgi:hypothetical protein
MKAEVLGTTWSRRTICEEPFLILCRDSEQRFCVEAAAVVPPTGRRLPDVPGKSGPLGPRWNPIMLGFSFSRSGYPAASLTTGFDSATTATPSR